MAGESRPRPCKPSPGISIRDSMPNASLQCQIIEHCLKHSQGVHERGARRDASDHRSLLESCVSQTSTLNVEIEFTNLPRQELIGTCGRKVLQDGRRRAMLFRGLCWSLQHTPGTNSASETPTSRPQCCPDVKTLGLAANTGSRCIQRSWTRPKSLLDNQGMIFTSRGFE